jgi:NAD(P)H-flavin reductase/ferredoxin
VADGLVAGARHRVTVAGSGETFEVAEGDRILAAARRAGIWFPFECGWGGCGTCKATVVEGETRLLFPGAPAVSPRDGRRRRILLCQSTPVADLVITVTSVAAVPRPERATADHRARLAAVERLGPGIGRFRFELEAVAAYRPGQFAVLELEPGLRRCYSMAGLPGTAELEFVVKRYPTGVATQRLFDLPLGTAVDVELPYGDLWLRDGERPLLLVAGGTGISAILALVRRLAADGDVRQVHVCYGATTREELVCWDELADLVAGLPHGRLHGALLRPDAAWAGTAGLVTDALAPLLPGLGDAEVYLAGPPPMVQAVQAAIREHGLPIDRVHVDSFGEASVKLGTPPTAARVTRLAATVASGGADGAEEAAGEPRISRGRGGQEVSGIR